MKKYLLGLAVALALPGVAYAAEPAPTPAVKKCCCCEKPADGKGCCDEKKQAADHSDHKMGSTSN